MNKKGFTLVELLAVIAILAILVIIALPNVMNLFNRAKEQAFETELKEIFKTAQQQWIADSMFNTQERTYAKCSSGNCPNQLEMSGRSELEYSVSIDKSGNVISFQATDGSYQYNYSGTGLKIEDIDEVTQISKIEDESDIITIECDDSASSGPYTGYIYFIQEATMNPGDSLDGWTKSSSAITQYTDFDNVYVTKKSLMKFPVYAKVYVENDIVSSYEICAYSNKEYCFTGNYSSDTTAFNDFKTFAIANSGTCYTSSTGETCYVRFDEYNDINNMITIYIYNYNYAGFAQGTDVFCNINNNTLSCFHD